ncbi:glycosyltransferase [Ktedonobacter robiniae]|uniref:Glycosyltransferase 2-like domain-containing protein n=1 Tax=Ktedonobacter robiniae TaxID=2778365 RepID=A0ABQ3UQJ5_9CHLR|nr:glycosyltransferase [Ktedonobacter robiniae]GHO54961.1 hypothetical protein KSB_34360 [Ktedonobacter robiniae]
MTIDSHDEHTIASRKLLDEIEESKNTTPSNSMYSSQNIQMEPQSDSDPHLHVNSSAKYDLSIIIPTRNERDNVVPLLSTLEQVLDNVSVEVIFVDDSDDDTPQIIRNAAEAMNSLRLFIQLEHRLPGPARSGGLATAVVEGLYLAKAEYITVLDADFQHPPELLRTFYEEAVAQQVDLVLASRYIKGGSSGGLNGFSRLFFSLGLKWLAKSLFPEQLSRISDPLGGCFLLKRSILQKVILRPIGYKILLEILLRCPWQHLVEVPYHFQQRKHGQSKADLRQGLMTLKHMARLFREVPAAGRIWKISALVLCNILVMAVLYILYPIVFGFWEPFTLPILGGVEPWVPFSLTVFALVALFNFFLLNRAIYPFSQVEQDSSSALTSIDQVLNALVSPPTEEALLSTKKLNHVRMSVDQLKTLPMPVVATLPALLPETPTVPLKTLARKPRSARQRVNRIVRLNRVFMMISFLLVLMALGVVGYMALDMTAYTIPNVWVVLATMTLGACIITANTRKKIDLHKVITMLLGISMAITFMDYMSWRVEVINWTGWWLALPLLFAEFLGALHTLGLQFTFWPRAQPKLNYAVNPTHAPIFIFIPTVNEGVTILEPTIRGALSARENYLSHYPWGEVTIVICNDGYVAQIPDWQTVEELAARMGVVCVTRKTPGGAKAGNIENARQLVGATGNALVVIFDADQVATEDFLLKTVPNLADPKVGWVQTGQYYRNLDNPVTRWADDQQSLFYNLLCPGKATWNSAFICGTNVVIRGQALDEIGGLPQDSVTEDFAASITLHQRWRSVYVSDVLATGLGPMDLSEYLKQQRRWATGTIGVLRTHWRDLFLPKKNGLQIGQRLQYFLACTHYLCGLRDLLYLLCPILFIFTGVPAVQGSTLNSFLLHFLPYFLVSAATIWYAGRGITGIRGIIIGFGSFPVLIESLMTVIFRRKVGFAVTSKKRSSKASRYLWVYIFFIVLCLAALAYSSQAKAKVYTALFISLMWVTYTLIMLFSFLALYLLDWRKHRAERRATGSAQSEQFSYTARVPQRARGLRSLRNAVVSVGLASLLLLTGTYHWMGAPSRAYPLVLPAGSAPYFGLDLPFSLLKTRPTAAEKELKANFAIIGRTQSVTDKFDFSWANNLAAHHAIPWVTLQFGRFQANGRPTNDAGLLSISHGLHDNDLTRWALDIRAYNKPVLITILLQVDRNWALTSAVANGSIPQDVAPAWLHTVSLFKQLGTNNVSWLWEPADPLNDQIYEPPLGSISAVVLDLIHYPGTDWGDPETLVQEAGLHFPGKPIILKVSASGRADQKSTWLSEIGVTAMTNHVVYALIYHDASPALKPNQALDKQWSITSDPNSLAVMSQLASQLQQRYAGV